MIYVLDANLYYGMAVEMARTLAIRVPFCNAFPDAIIVGFWMHWKAGHMLASR